MTVTARPGDPPKRRVLMPGTRPFIGVLALCMAVTALGIDTVLPAFPEIRTSLDLDPDATEVTGLITFFFIGSSLGLLPAGLLADRFGRRPVMWGGLALYVLGAIGSVAAPTIEMMFVTRFVWGLGSAGPRVAAMAMVRDAYEGAQMARQMSLVMAVFILVPTFAPALAVGILAIGPWQAIFWACAAVAVAVSGGVSLLPETLSTDLRRGLSAGDVWRSCAIVLRTPGTPAYLLSLTALFGVFLSYLASSEIILDQVFDLEEWFPVFFGGIALAMGAAMYLNGRVVERVGLARIIRFGFAANWLAAGLLFVVALVTAGEPPFWLFVVLLGAVLFFQQMLIPNLNAAAMQPLAQVAGTGAALLGMIAGAVGAVIGGGIDRQFDGTITPLSIGFIVSSTVAALAWRRADRAALTTDAA
ncbi:MAG: MFS transporter [Ilumatobacter sp.]|uniref:MFS transporter n=1 Tax=Ilumatobacter sp. TaxID=1967498 RepID=UPI0026260B0F|nr:MFS transporter [Ilumatobacter sp.]MDJ0768243.1 MFS transporter [Ilumatobacter sp.]